MPKRKRKTKRKKSNWIYIETKGKKTRLNKDLILTKREYDRGVKRHKKW